MGSLIEFYDDFFHCWLYYLCFFLKEIKKKNNVENRKKGVTNIKYKFGQKKKKKKKKIYIYIYTYIYMH